MIKGEEIVLWRLFIDWQEKTELYHIPSGGWWMLFLLVAVRAPGLWINLVAK